MDRTAVTLTAFRRSCATARAQLLAAAPRPRLLARLGLTLGLLVSGWLLLSGTASAEESAPAPTSTTVPATAPEAGTTATPTGDATPTTVPEVTSPPAPVATAPPATDTATSPTTDGDTPVVLPTDTPAPAASAQPTNTAEPAPSTDPTVEPTSTPVVGATGDPTTGDTSPTTGDMPPTTGEDSTAAPDPSQSPDPSGTASTQPDPSNPGSTGTPAPSSTPVIATPVRTSGHDGTDGADHSGADKANDHPVVDHAVAPADPATSSTDPGTSVTEAATAAIPAVTGADPAGALTPVSELPAAEPFGPGLPSPVAETPIVIDTDVVHPTAKPAAPVAAADLAAQMADMHRVVVLYERSEPRHPATAKPADSVKRTSISKPVVVTGRSDSPAGDTPAGPSAPSSPTVPAAPAPAAPTVAGAGAGTHTAGSGGSAGSGGFALVLTLPQITPPNGTAVRLAAAGAMRLPRFSVLPAVSPA